MKQEPIPPDYVPTAEDAAMSAIASRYLPPGAVDAMTDAEIDELLAQTMPVHVDVAGLIAGIEDGNDRALPSGREIHGAASPLQTFGKWAAAALILAIIGLMIKQASTPDAQTAGSDASSEEWRVDFPPPVFVGTPPLSVSGLTDRLGNPINVSPPRLSLRVPQDARSNVALGKRVTSSAPLPIEGELDFVTDGIRSSEAIVTLEPGMQWIQLDLAGLHEIYGVVVWHDYSTQVVYSDVVVVISDDPEFKSNVRVVFNNSRDGQFEQGIEAGDDPAYLETNYGRVIETNAVIGRYVRLYSNGCSQDIANRYTEVETYGRKLP